MKRLAVLDLGSNTFNLLIIEIKNNNAQIIFEEKTPVKIGENSFLEKILQAEPIKRGKKAIKAHVLKAKEFQVSEIFGIATSAIRNAKNGALFIDELNKEFDLNIEIISGDKEAELIYYGVKSSLTWKDNAILIDIGGGSNEVSIASNHQSYFSKSYDLGVSRMKQLFVGNLPLNPIKIEAIKNYYIKELLNLSDEINKLNPKLMIGSAGTFDSLAQVDSYIKSDNSTDKNTSYTMKVEDFHSINNQLKKMSLAELKSVKGLPPFRAEFIIYGTLFIETVLEMTQVKNIVQSPNSLKEGYITKLLNT